MKTSIITLDIINDLCHPDGKLARYIDRIERSNVIKNINSITEWGREHNILNIHVRLGFRSNYKDGSAISPIFKLASEKRILQISEWGSQFCDALDRAEDDIEIIKHRVSAFYGTDLDLILRANKIERLILTGVATNNAVELTAREAHDRDYAVTVISDATECSDNEAKKASLNFLSRIAEVKTTASLIK